MSDEVRSLEDKLERARALGTPETVKYYEGQLRAARERMKQDFREATSGSVDYSIGDLESEGLEFILNEFDDLTNTTVGGLQDIRRHHYERYKEAQIERNKRDLAYNGLIISLVDDELGRRERGESPSRQTRIVKS